jgi:hypothetical protein
MPVAASAAAASAAGFFSRELQLSQEGDETVD